MTIEEYEKQFGNCYCKGGTVEEEGMIQFDETSNCLAGPFDGGYAYYMIQDCRTLRGWNVVSFDNYKLRCRFSQYNIPNWNGKGLKNPAENEEQLQKRLEKLTDKERKYWQIAVEKEIKYCDYPTLENPIRFYICGNDDSSWTKFFPTVESAKEELKLYLSMQPINYQIHISDNGFVFTN